jgi:hypothetical protein
LHRNKTPRHALPTHGLVTANGQESESKKKKKKENNALHAIQFAGLVGLPCKYSAGTLGTLGLAAVCIATRC